MTFVVIFLRAVRVAMLGSVLVGCGASVGAESDAPGGSTGGNAAGTGGTSGAGNSPGVGGSGISFSVGGTAGTGSALPTQCVTPYDPGLTCDYGAYTAVYVFDSTLGCIPVAYNGCGGNGWFYQVSPCQALCEQRPSDSSCPLQFPFADACSKEGTLCSYNRGSCLCTILGSNGCAVTDPRCGTLGLNSKPATRSPCTSETCTIRQAYGMVPPMHVCTCSNGFWDCVPV